MGLQWMILACVVAAEAVVAALLMLPAPRAVRNQIVGLVSLLLQPIATIIPFAAFHLLDISIGSLRTGSCAPLKFAQPTSAFVSRKPCSKRRGMLSFVFRHASFISVFTELSNTAKTSRHWKRLRGASRKSSLSS